MANLTITAANVKQVLNGTPFPTRKKAVVWGATVVAGNSVARDPSSGKWVLADNNVSAIISGTEGVGIALSGGGDDQPGFVAVGGDLDINATMTIGETYQVSSGAGLVAPVGDISTNYPTTLGLALTANRIRLNPLATGIAHG